MLALLPVEVMIVELHQAIKLGSEQCQPDAVQTLKTPAASLSERGLYTDSEHLRLRQFIKTVHPSHSFFDRKELEKRASHRCMPQQVPPLPLMNHFLLSLGLKNLLMAS